MSGVNHGVTAVNEVDDGDLLCLAATHDEYGGQEPHSVSGDAYLSESSIENLFIDERRKCCPDAKFFAVCNSKLLRRVRVGLKLVPSIAERQTILPSYHDEIGHWEIFATMPLSTDRFWCPNIYIEVYSYVKSRGHCQRFFVPKYYSNLKTPPSSIFDVNSIDFAGPLQRTARENGFPLD